jgi:hypothetical protein
VHNIFDFYTQRWCVSEHGSRFPNSRERIIGAGRPDRPSIRQALRIIKEVSMGSEQKVAVITGASEGIGAALVSAYRDRNY